jgi:L-alanine-DL-glutamate epimerase-like enolase superfamily enzyme
MKITDVEVHEIHPSLCPWKGDVIRLYLGDVYDTRTIVILHTDNGLEGIGELGGPPNTQLEEELEKLCGTNPCTWLAHPTLRIGLATAVYDLVGKANDVPAYYLFGPQVRSWVPVGYWTVSQTPAKMAEEVKYAVEQGYTWFKYHTDHFHNVIDQTRAMQEVAPPGLKIHYDMNFDSTVGHVITVTRALAQFPVAGLIEDPLPGYDLEGHKILRQKCALPIVIHHLALGGREALIDLADGYMLGHSSVGNAIGRAGLFDAANVPFMLQNVGGNITRAMVVHMAAAFRMATMHHMTDTFAWEEDVVTPVLKVVNGVVRVPEEPGLGLKLDREALERLKSTEPAPLPKALIRVTCDRGPTIYGRPPRLRRDHLRLEQQSLPLAGEGYDLPIDYDFWYDDGSERFARLWEQTGYGVVIE